ncbi:MAG: DUF72 domain-containing protein [Sphingomonas sp.]|uniref:DUF72 domain-containing protein n=1 Tax=Sphingomonas sp. TaxID=28214 RepID=UPI0018119B30|nr:DUF72 domain-containing protein [Sphingomonas sp.]MBA3668133.1 DUF72 domain-containing protein [Sphingomonas sp.]
MTKGNIRVGIGGWDYDPWRGTFYPDGLAKTKQLAWAAERLTAIEINATYYGSQKPATFAKWAEAVPDGFQFSVKASRYATNRKILAEGAESIGRFLNQGITELGDRLGPILWQFMATKKFNADDFAAFLKLLPEKQDGLRLRHALEVRHDSFRDPAFLSLAKAANAAIVFADSDEFPEIEEPTADFTYSRLQRSIETCPTGYDEASLKDWADRAKIWASRGDTYVFFISGAKVRNPAAATGLIERLKRG